MHMFSKSEGFYGGHGIVGAQVPIGAGIAFANKYKKNKHVCFTYFGEGAANQGQVYEAFNMASLWKLPVVFVIENNQYAMGTSMTRASSTEEMFARGMAFNIPGKAVNGMNVLEVAKNASSAADHCRSGKGPFILEMKTYRYRGHSMSDPAKYRTREEVQKIREEKDPIDTLRSLLIEKHKISEKEFKTIDSEIKAVVTEASDFALDSPEPNIEELWTDVYAN